MSGLVHRRVAVLAVHLQFASVKSMAERNRLQRPVSGIECFGAGDAKKQDARVGPTSEDQHPKEGQKLIGPSGK